MNQGTVLRSFGIIPFGITHIIWIIYYSSNKWTNKSDYKTTVSAEIRMKSAIYYEDMQAADNGQIEICVGASSFANQDTSGLAKSTEACFKIEIMDEDTMPPLFCSAAELQVNNFEEREPNIWPP